MLIIFNANNCVYCDKLKHEIQNDKEVQNILKNTYNSYYINISYHKIHNYNNKKTSTEELSREFNIDATPMPFDLKDVENMESLLAKYFF